MKTPMQELLDIIYKAISNAEELKSNGLNYQVNIDIMLNVLNVYRVIIERDMLQKEKEHFIKAVNITEQEAVDFCNEQVKHYYDHEGMFGAVPEAGINYYNETYNDNE